MARFNRENYFEIDINDLPLGVELPFSVFVYLKLNDRLVGFRRRGRSLQGEDTKKLKCAGIFTCYIAVEEKEIFENFRKGRKQSASATPTEDITSVSANDATLDYLNGKKEKGLQLLKDLVGETPTGDFSFEHLIDDQSNEHSVNVAVYSVLFAMGLGNIDKQQLNELAVASLLHEIGLTQLIPTIITFPETKRSEKVSQHYLKHVEYGLSLLNELGIIPPRGVIGLLKKQHVRYGVDSSIDEF